jgi:flagellar biosynthesis/type III secretory pathway M-ring protein FliF/YscJ
MTTGEILVIAAAAAVFIVINIIMWSIIIRKERKAAAKETAAAPKGDSIALPDTVPASAAEMGFRLLENTVIIHTDDRI